MMEGTAIRLIPGKRSGKTRMGKTRSGWTRALECIELKTVGKKEKRWSGGAMVRKDGRHLREHGLNSTREELHQPVTCQVCRNSLSWYGWKNFLCGTVESKK